MTAPHVQLAQCLAALLGSLGLCFSVVLYRAARRRHG